MQIKIKYIKLHNFLSFENAELGFNNSGYTLVQGVNNNLVDKAVSNGSGKSSIFEAIAWCLTGELIRGSKNVKRIGADEKDNCWVSLEFDIDDNKYGICREANPSKLSFNVNGKDESGKGIRDTDKIIQEYLPNLNSSLIGSVIILGQGLPQRFSNNTPSGRKEVLEKLSNSDAMLYDLKNRINDRWDKLAETSKNFSDELLQVVTRKEMCEKEIASLQSDLDNLPDIEKLNALIETLTSTQVDNQLQLDELNKQIETLSSDKEQLLIKVNNLNKEYNETLKNETDTYNEELANVSKSKIEQKTILDSKIKEVNRLKNIKDVCPTCGQKLPGVEKIDTSALEEEIEKLRKTVGSIEQNEADIKDKISKITLSIQSDFESEIYDINMSINSISTQISSNKKIATSLDATIKDQTAQISKYETQKQNRESLKESLENKIQQANNLIEMYNSKILYINNEKDELQKHIDIVQKMKTVIQRDFRGYLLSSVIDFINRKAKEYSQEVFETDKINFSLDGNNIEISYDGKEYSNLSGGERQKIDLIIQFALRDMLCKYLDFSSNIIVVDELFDNLDSVGCEKILDFISNKLTDVESIYIVTHHADIPIPFDNILTVTKGEDGISRIN